MPTVSLHNTLPAAGRFAAAVLVSVALAPMSGGVALAAAPATNLPAITAGVAAGTAGAGYEGQVEAVRQTVLAAQVPGSITLLQARVGDRVRAGQVLARIDARAAEQGVAAGNAQVAAARANLNVATTELERKRQLYAKNYIAKASLEQAEAVHQAAQAQVDALGAQVNAAQAQSGFHVVRAPYDGIVSAVTVELGDMAMPGRPLITVYDPAALRVTAAIPATVAGQAAAAQVKLEVPALGEAGRELKPARVQVLPVVDPQTMTREVRAELPRMAGAVPGQFARLWLPGAPVADRTGEAAGKGGSVQVPRAAVVRRGEVSALYVLDAAGQPLLRQVRLGRAQGDSVEVLAGVEAGERVVTDPQAAARLAGAPAPATGTGK